MPYPGTLSEYRWRTKNPGKRSEQVPWPLLQPWILTFDACWLCSVGGLSTARMRFCSGGVDMPSTALEETSIPCRRHCRPAIRFEETFKAGCIAGARKQNNNFQLLVLVPCYSQDPLFRPNTPRSPGISLAGTKICWPSHRYILFFGNVFPSLIKLRT